MGSWNCGLRNGVGGESYLERLCIPVLDLLDGGHFAESIREFPQVLDTVSESDWEFLGEELRGTKQCSYFKAEVTRSAQKSISHGYDINRSQRTKNGHTSRRSVSKLDHLPKGDTSGGEAGIMSDGLHQPLRRLPHGVCR